MLSIGVIVLFSVLFLFFFFQAEDGIRDAQESRGLGDVYKRQGGRTLEFDAVDVTTGTKAGVHWRKNPIPRAWKTKTGEWGHGSNHEQTGIGFQPVCEDHGMDQQGTQQSCTGMWGPYNLEVVDTVQVPEDLAPGNWVMNWRLDCEESNQIWQSCSDLAITGNAQ
eukprot:TRINITY_DN56039_c0_g1_i1.p1 TRINITY_DN56039_c0_g1~~TRINITY_DN56039_c0_g1_i1.p1  ORF type:complete len:165 (+),score=42.00 TRINITY_DN56039_c0_g1_i1:37-531(+)